MSKVKSDKPTIREIKFAEAKAKGLNSTEAALVVSPDLSRPSAAVAGSELLRKPNVQKLLDEALEKHKITIERAVEPIDKGLKAKKVASIEGDFYQTEVDDIPVQMQASDRALKLLGVTDKPKTAETDEPSELAPALVEALKAGNIQELQRIIFKTDKEPVLVSSEIGTKVPVEPEKVESHNVELKGKGKEPSPTKAE